MKSGGEVERGKGVLVYRKPFTMGDFLSFVAFFACRSL
jgi:hypothetical protein